MGGGGCLTLPFSLGRPALILGLGGRRGPGERDGEWDEEWLLLLAILVRLDLLPLRLRLLEDEREDDPEE